MVQGLVLFKVKQISRKKEQMHGFYLQLKNILTTFPKKFPKFDHDKMIFYRFLQFWKVYSQIKLYLINFVLLY